jgi:hypothetical protein
VLEDIEDKMKEETHKLILNDEVAATISQENKPQEQGRPISSQANGNWNIEISTLSIIDAIEGIYKVNKFISKKFRRK